ncbi:RtcB family protein [Nibrella viscosa]|uniref:3'-phosphate/5'-hydroxy nucleic acid ligase n=1 Tax=Nibrella viscosa TaxID=1084524 RepID=A0ABP8KY08_9BACT
MVPIHYFCDTNTVEQNALEQLERYAENPFVEKICAFTDIHFCDEKAIPVGVAFSTTDYVYPLITGKDIGCGVMYLRISKADWLRPFNKAEHYKAFNLAHTRMTDDGLGGGNHFLSIEEDADNVYVICHTGTRDRGIGLYQQCLGLTQSFSAEYGQQVQFVHKDFLDAGFVEQYNRTLRFGYERRKNFCLKTLVFLQTANYVRAEKTQIDPKYLSSNLAGYDEEGTLNGTSYKLEDSIHNHLRFGNGSIIHRKGSTELTAGKTVVIPLSMSRGSLLVKLSHETQGADALNSCAHGAGRRLSRFQAMKHWKTGLKEKERRSYRERFSELLDRSGDFPNGYIQEFDFAYKDASELFTYQPYLKKITQTEPIVTVKYTEI